MGASDSLREKLRVVRNNARVFGYVSTLRSVLAHLVAPFGKDDFDEKHGVSTHEMVEVADADIPGPNREHAVHYQPSHPRVLRHVLESLPIDPSEFVFVDLGSGKGRALLMSAALPFRRIVGVELSPSLCAVADENLASFRGERRCADVQVLCADVCDFELPEEDTVFYLFNPFHRPVLRRVVENVRVSVARSPRRILVAYCHAADGTDLLEEAGFRKLSETRLIQPWYSWSLWELGGSPPPDR